MSHSVKIIIFRIIIIPFPEGPVVIVEHPAPFCRAVAGGVYLYIARIGMQHPGGGYPPVHKGIDIHMLAKVLIIFLCAHIVGFGIFFYIAEGLMSGAVGSIAFDDGDVVRVYSVVRFKICLVYFLAQVIEAEIFAVDVYHAGLRIHYGQLKILLHHFGDKGILYFSPFQSWPPLCRSRLSKWVTSFPSKKGSPLPCVRNCLLSEWLCFSAFQFGKSRREF